LPPGARAARRAMSEFVRAVETDLVFCMVLQRLTLADGITVGH
jgi:hypothetical protein